MGSRLTWNTDGKHWPNSAASSFVRAGGLNWHVQSLGSGPPIVLIHGTASSVHTWAGIAPLLAKNYALTLFDLPGHGFSEPLEAEQMSLGSIATRAAELLNTLGVKPEILIGHSAGASIAVQMACDARIARPRGIIAINGALLPFSGAASWMYPIAARLLAASHLPARIFAWRAAQEGATERVIRATGSRLGAEEAKYYRQLFSCEKHVQAALDMMTHWDLRPLLKCMPALSLPVHLITCGEDLAVPSEQAFGLKEMLPRCEVHYVRGLGHLAHEEAPAHIGDLVMRLCHTLVCQDGATIREAAS